MAERNERTNIRPNNNNNTPALPRDNPAIARPFPRVLFFLTELRPAMLNPIARGNNAKVTTGSKNILTMPAIEDINPHFANLSTLSAFSSLIFFTFFAPFVLVVGTSTIVDETLWDWEVFASGINIAASDVKRNKKTGSRLKMILLLI